MRSYLAGWGRPQRGDWVAGLTNAIVYLPQGIGYGIVAGVNPLFGLYTGIFAPTLAALTAGSIFMVVIATNELSVPVGRIAATLSGGLDPARLATLTLLVGVFAVLAALLRLGYVIRFISNSVMTGFVLGIMLLLILGQAANVTGFEGKAHGNDVSKVFEILTRPNDIRLAATAVGAATIASVLLLQRTRLNHFAFLIPLVAFTALEWLLKVPGVPLVGEAHRITNGLPHLVLPNLGAIPELAWPALSLTLIALSFSAGVAEAFPNPDGRIGKPSQDFLAQGLANLGGACFQCLPAAGSMSRTVYVVEAGARTRWANLLTGLAGVVVVLTLANLASLVPLSVVGGMLIVIGINAIDPHKLRLVWAVNWLERIFLVLTAGLTIFASPTTAILVGVVVSLLVVLVQSARLVSVHEIVRTADDRLLEQDRLAAFAPHSVKAVRLHGFLYFAGVESVAEALEPALAVHNLVLVVSLRQYSSLGSTGIAYFERLAHTLRAQGSVLMLADVADNVRQELAATGVLAELGANNVFAAMPGEQSLELAFTAGQAWLEPIAAARLKFSPREES